MKRRLRFGRLGRFRNSTSNSIAPAVKWKTASRSGSAYSATDSAPRRFEPTSFASTSPPWPMC